MAKGKRKTQEKLSCKTFVKNGKENSGRTGKRRFHNEKTRLGKKKGEKRKDPSTEGKNK